jgi:RimJ/RimL family protein N-acetyltransferase
LILETERLSIRPLSTADDAFILRLLNEPSFLDNIGDKGVRTLDDARSYLLNGPIASYEKNGFGLWLVSIKTTGMPIGICGLLKRDVLEDVDVGYALVPEHWSQGYAAEVVAAVIAYAKTALGLARLVAVVDAANARSIRLLERLGFRYERRMRLAPDEGEILLFGS